MNAVQRLCQAGNASRLPFGRDRRVAGRQDTRLIDLSHAIEAGMITYKGLPGPPRR